MSKIIMMGTAAAPGVPSLVWGYGQCNPNNPKNLRTRSGTYLEMSGTRLLIDTSPDLRTQLIEAKIKEVDAVLYTHAHADHLHGIDDLREINRLTKKPLDIYASHFTMDLIKTRFSYLINTQTNSFNPTSKPSLTPHEFDFKESFMIKNLKVTPFELFGHNIESTGYMFNDGELIYIADFKKLDETLFELLHKKPQLLIMPLTLPSGCTYHASFDEIKHYAKRINAKKTLLNHMAIECDYDEIKAECLEGMEPAYDGEIVEFSETPNDDLKG